MTIVLLVNQIGGMRIVAGASIRLRQPLIACPLALVEIARDRAAAR
jgi:hypothetical protein